MKKPAEYRVRPLPIDAAKLNGLSEKLIVSHHQNNYAGAVKRLNAIRTQLADVAFDTAPVFQINGLKREELIATNSMLLHELHFACLGGDGKIPAAMSFALDENFGSADRWKSEFVAMGKALGGGSGWVLLTLSPRDGTLSNQWASDHSQTMAGGVPILALDMYEHAYHLDFGAQAGAWVDAFMQNINWEDVYERYQAAVHGASEGLGIAPANTEGAVLVDVRRSRMYAKADKAIPGAVWRDPGKVHDWAQELPSDKDVIVYCAFGHEVGRSTAMQLRSQGIRAKFIEGGIEGWAAAGLPLADKPS